MNINKQSRMRTEKTQRILNAYHHLIRDPKCSITTRMIVFLVGRIHVLEADIEVTLVRYHLSAAETKKTKENAEDSKGPNEKKTEERGKQTFWRTKRATSSIQT
jgi:hypothetical protein